jgi:GDP-L-fucose synthase
MNSQLLEEAYRAGVKKFIFISSSAAYPPSDDRPVKEEEMFEGDPFDVYFAVGWMKRYSEILCKMYAEKINPKMACVVVRPANVYGPGDKFDPKTSHMMASLIRRAAERENPFVVWGSGQEVRDMIYIDDFIDGLMLAAKNLEGFDPVNIASGKGHSIKDIISAILKAEDFHVDVTFDATKPTVAPIRLIDASKAERLLGFKAAISLEEGIRRTLAWYKENKLAVSS